MVCDLDCVAIYAWNELFLGENDKIHASSERWQRDASSPNDQQWLQAGPSAYAVEWKCIDRQCSIFMLTHNRWREFWFDRKRFVFHACIPCSDRMPIKKHFEIIWRMSDIAGTSSHSRSLNCSQKTKGLIRSLESSLSARFSVFRFRFDDCFRRSGLSTQIHINGHWLI